MFDLSVISKARSAVCLICHIIYRGRLMQSVCGSSFFHLFHDLQKYVKISPQEYLFLFIQSCFPWLTLNFYVNNVSVLNFLITYLCLSQARTWISNISQTFLCSVNENKGLSFVLLILVELLTHHFLIFLFIL